MELKTSERLTERHVQAIWYDRDLRPPELATCSGEAVNVVNPGEWNLGPGPDFRNAVFEVGPERKRVKGDVEVHLHPSDWTRHNHERDPEYKRVVAHVVWHDGRAPCGLPPDAMSICIGDKVLAEGGFTPSMVDVSAYPFSRLPLPDRPCFEAFRGKTDEAIATIAAAGKRRLAQKAARLRSIRAARPGEDGQIFYEEIMNALGYKLNSRAFRQMARSVPACALLAEPQIAVRAMQTAAGFYEWRYSGNRPWNSPARRIVAAANIFTKTDIFSMRTLSGFDRTQCREAVKQLSRGGWIGRGRAAAILANVIVPFAGASPDWLPPEDVSSVIKLTALRLFGRDHDPAIYRGNGLMLQGLIQIYREYCLGIYPWCQNCPLA